MWTLRTLATIALLICSAPELMAATVTVTWNSNAEPDLAGYIVSYGTQSGTHPSSVDVGNVTSCQLTLSAGQRYYVVVQAYNTKGRVGAKSAEVFADIVDPAAPVVASLSPTSGAVGTLVTISGSSLGSTQGTSSVRFNGTVATPTTWSASSIVVPVPSGATTGAVVVTVNGVASNGVTFTVTTATGLPAPWSSQDVGNPALAGQATYASGTFSVSGAGVDIWSSSDQFRFVYQTLTGDGEIVARVASLQNTDAWAKAAVMIREDLAGNSPNAVAQVTAGNGMTFQSRVTRGGTSTSINGFPGTAPQWIRLVRSGHTFTGYYSANGTTWTTMGSATVAMTAQVYAGLAVTSHIPSLSSSATFTDVALTGSAGTNQAPVMTQPANQTSAEGANVSLQLTASDPEGTALTYSASGLPASLSLNATTGLISGTLTFTSAGTHTVTATASDGTLSNSKTFTWTVSDVSQAPVVASLSPTSGAVGTLVTISGSSLGSTQGTSSVRFNGTVATPTTWSASSIVVPVPSGATTGAVVVTVNGVASNGVTFTVTTATGLPAPWSSQDVGNPALAGQATYASGTFSVSGAGVDIWSSSDQFRFVYQTLTGDGEIVARVASLQNTDAWAKAAVMIREDLAGNSPNAVAQVTAGNGMTFQSRVTRGGTSTSINGFPGTAPQWIRLVRSGHTFTGYYSANGTTWTTMGSATVAMTAQVYAGLAVTSHIPSLSSSATFTDVALTGSAGTNQAPVMTQPANQTSAEGANVSLQLTASDPEGTALTYSASGLPASLSLNATTGLISGTLTFTSAGTHTVTATASDGTLSNSKTFTWTVSDVSQAPVVASLSPTSGAVGTLVTISGSSLGSTQGTSSVRFNGTVATPTTWSASSIVVPVPSGATTGAVVVTVNGVASNGVTFTVTTATGLPAPWSSQDVGNPALAGQATYASGTFSVSGAGVDIWSSSDQFRFVYQTLTGDGEIVARVASLQNTDAWAKAAVIIREDLAGNSPNAVAQVTAGNGMTFQSRVTRGGTSTSINGFPGTAPQWIRLVRSGHTFTGYYSANGTTWTTMGSATVAMTAQVYTGLAVTSHIPSLSSSATFTDVALTGSAGTNQAPVMTQPANQTSAEGANVSLQLTASDPEGTALTYSASGLPASLSLNATTGLISGTLTFTSAGTHTVTATASDGTLSNSKTFTWTVSDVSQAPVVASLSPTSGAVGTLVTISGSSLGSTQGTSSVRFNGTVATPTTWSASSIVVPVPSGATTGAVVVTVNGVASNGVTFTVTTATGLPAPWSSQDVGNPALAGQATYASGTFSVSGAGVDIWSSSDQFRFVYQTLTGDGEIVARVASLQNTDAWAKAAVMIREDLAGNSPNAVAQVTAGNGMTFQSRVTRGGTSTSINGFPGTAPQWIRLVRSGHTFTGYYSANGTAWTLMGSSTVPMASQVYIGLALTSHNPSLRTSATFTDVALTGGVATTQMSAPMTAPASTTTAEAVSAQSSTATTSGAAARADGVTVGDYDGDGRADLAGYRSSTSEWEVLPSGTGYEKAVVTPWGGASDLRVPGDYDGDGKTDLAFYRPSTGLWSILESSSGSTTNVDVWLGPDAGVPVPGDYDGDGMTDVAVYSPAAGQWRILTSSTRYAAEIVTLWGMGTDRPAPGDYDGDGRTDLAVYRPTTGEWHILQSRSDYTTNVTLGLGTSADIPVPADYDGDGITDAAVFQPSTGTWRVRSSSGRLESTVVGTLGAGTDVPVARDYDGDGRADLSIFRAGTWQILYSSKSYASGVSITSGSGTDVPVSGQ